MESRAAHQTDGGGSGVRLWPPADDEQVGDEALCGYT